MESSDRNGNTCDEGEVKDEDYSYFTLVSFDSEDELITDALEKTDAEKPVLVNTTKEAVPQTCARTDGQQSSSG